MAEPIAFALPLAAVLVGNGLTALFVLFCVYVARAERAGRTIPAWVFFCGAVPPLALAATGYVIKSAF